jgi:hypothetical protein
MAAAKSPTPPKPSSQSMPVSDYKPAFDDFIKMQSSEGFWDAMSRTMLAHCIEGGTTDDSAVLQALNELGISDVRVYLTLLALFILEEAYTENEEEWQMIAKKARTFLEQ